MKFKPGDYMRFVGYELDERDYELVKNIALKDKIYKAVAFIRDNQTLKWYVKHICEDGSINGLAEIHYERVINITKEQKQKLKDMIRSI